MTTNFIYLVAGERNTKPGSVSDSGGLYANVGMTEKGRLPESRFRDPDYRKKQTGGQLVLLKQWEVGTLKDHALHAILKQIDGVVWDRFSNNTEEFLFIGDPGDGSVAATLIESIIEDHLVPEFVSDKIHKLQQTVETETARRKLAEEAEPWQLLQDTLTSETLRLEEEYGLRMAELENENKSHLKKEEAKIQLKLSTTEAARKRTQVELYCVESRAKSLRNLLFLTASLLIGSTVLNLSGSKEAVAETRIQEVDTRLHDREINDRDMKISQLNRRIEQLESEKKEKTQRALTAAEKKHKHMCLSASSCESDSQSDNSFVCSTYKGATRYKCRYTVEGRLPGCDYGGCIHSRTIELRNGKAYSGAYAFKIVKYEAYK